jgi:hypothetical protein
VTVQPVLTSQGRLFGGCPIEEAVARLALSGSDERGAIFTRPEVVDFILDLVGYTDDHPLHQMRILEPSFGGGDFLLPIVRRLIGAYRRFGGSKPAAELRDAVQGVELHTASFTQTVELVRDELVSLGLTELEARSLSQNWLRQGDFLLSEFAAGFHFVVGNPPYIRSELIPDVLIAEYRRRYATIYDRADIYIPFLERSLDLLVPGGAAGFICADRWMKNRYGGPLRELIARQYHLRAYVDMVDTPAFRSDVIAYPGIFIFGNEKGSSTQIAVRPSIDVDHLAILTRALRDESTDAAVTTAQVVSAGGQPWVIEQGSAVRLVRALEARLPTLEEAGCKVGIGVATGADKAFIGPLDALDVEDDRKLPLVMTRDIQTGAIEWRGLGVVNPFADGGGLVDLAAYPRLKRYLEARKAEIAGRHVAQKSPASWYRTIDRIYPALVTRPKLLIPDIKGSAHIVHDEGRYYPHHNLYYITSESWDLRALQAVLQSGVARLFVETYSTKMRGGYLRFQAQYLRRIRVPHWRDVPPVLRHRLVDAAARSDHAACNAVVAALYNLSEADCMMLQNAAGAP